MANSCKTCKRPDVNEINKRLANGAPLREIVSHYGVPRASIQRHKENCIGNNLFAEVREQRRSGLLADVDEVRKEIRDVRLTFADNPNVRVGLVGKMLDVIDKEAKLTGAFVQDKANPATVAEIAKRVVQDLLAAGGTKEDAIKYAAKRYGILEADLLGI